MEAMRSTWTDSRLDDLNDRVDHLRDDTNARMAEMSGRIDAFQHAMTQGFIAMAIVMVSGF